MAKKFTIVTIDGNKEVFLMGFKEPKDLKDSDIVVNILMDYSSLVKVNINMNHCLFLDYPGPDEDISKEDLGYLLDNFDYMLENEHIYSEEMADFKINGLKEEELVEEI